MTDVFNLPVGVVVLLVVLMALFMFWGSEQLERIVGKRDMSKEPKLRLVGAGTVVALAVGVIVIGSPSLEKKYSRVTITRTYIQEAPEDATEEELACIGTCQREIERGRSLAQTARCKSPQPNYSLRCMTRN